MLRFASKILTGSNFWLDDYFIGIALFAGIPSTVLSVQGLTANGLGRDIWTITFNQITDFAHMFYVMELLYFVNIALLKLSLLFFYLRVFPDPKLRQLLWGSIALDVLFGFVFVLTGLLQCQPMDYYWNKWDGEHKGSCINVNAVGWANAAISIALDLWMIGLPMSQVVKLKLHWKKKVGVGIMFIVGTLYIYPLPLPLKVTYTKSPQANHPTASQLSASSVSNLSPNFRIPPTRRGIILQSLSGQRLRSTPALSAHASPASAFSLCICSRRFSGARIPRIQITMHITALVEYPEMPQSINLAMSQAMAFPTRGESCTPRVMLWTAVHYGSKMRRI